MDSSSPTIAAHMRLPGLRKTCEQWLRRSACLLLAFAALPSISATPVTVDLADQPLFGTVSVPGNLILALSVEWPTATTPAYPISTEYAPSATFLGYFDPAKCYTYKAVNTGTSAKPDYSTSYFDPSAKANAHVCSDGWSGNYLNWASMQTLDAFRWVLTGGFRSVDTSSETILTKTFAAKIGSAPKNPDKALTSNLSGAVPMTTWTSVATSIKNQGTAMLFSGAGTKGLRGNFPGAGCLKDKFCVDSTKTVVDYGSDDELKASAVYRVYINVKVCDPKFGLEQNCKQYGSSYKPEGLMQSYAGNLRYSAFGYLNDSNGSRDGGVMRARMNFIGPTQPVLGAAAIKNPAPEWSPDTGVMLPNPNSGDSRATATALGLASAAVANSGVMNYLNKFGYASGTYKASDPVSELYYAALRYFKHQGNVAAYTDMSKAKPEEKPAFADGFPVITQWDDPIIYSCQKNFILGIGDVNTHSDSNIADDLVDVQKATNMVGQLEGYSGLASAEVVPTFGNTYFIAGLAYDAHTMDIRPDEKAMPDKQTVNTYWMDVQEDQVFRHKNQYWLAAKYGGFKVPEKFEPYSRNNGTGSIGEESGWRTNTDTLTFQTDPSFNTLTYSTDGSGTTDKRPDNYFPGDRPEAMQDGLTKAFAKIAGEVASAHGTALATASPNVTSSGAVSYSASYDAKNWTGAVVASTVTFDPKTDAPTSVTKWSAQDVLDASSVTASSRKIVTCCTSGGAGLPFTVSALKGTQLNYASFGAVLGVAKDSQSVSDYVDYLRGDRSKEIGNATDEKKGKATDDKKGKYRARASRLGDIINAKPLAVGAPSFPYFEVYNPGYGAFKSTQAKRKTVVYAGTNDGMLHAFDGSVDTAESGSELFAYVPSFVYGSTSTANITGLASLGNPNFTHHYFVDATPGQFDLDLNKTSGATGKGPDWRTLLIGGLGKGGKGYYAIDVTDPTKWTGETEVAGKVMWEFTDLRMGYSYGAASVVKTKKYGWVVVLTSGYNNSDGKGYFFFVNPRTGELLEAVATTTGSNSAPVNLAHHTVFVPHYTDMTGDAIYAGDLQGNLWRVDLTGATGSYSAPTQIATLTNAQGEAQPVTTRPLVEADPSSSKRYVMVGTGQMMGESDITSKSAQAFYAIVDGTDAFGGFYTSGSANSTLPSGASFPVARNALQANTDLLTGIGSKPTSVMGWYFDLPVSDNIGQRVNVDATANRGTVAFIGNLPVGSACEFSGTGTLYAVNFATGQTVLQKVDDATTSSNGAPATVSLIASSKPIKGTLTEVSIMRVNGKLRLYAGGSTGDVVHAPANLNTAAGVKQLNWREVPLSE